MYVYKRTEPSLWTVGFYTPEGKWEPDSDHDSPGKAAERVRCLNSGDSHQLAALRRQVDELRQEMEALLMIVEGGYPAALVAKAVEQARDALARQEVTE